MFRPWEQEEKEQEKTPQGDGSGGSNSDGSNADNEGTLVSDPRNYATCACNNGGPAFGSRQITYLFILFHGRYSSVG